jgi:hypothetical protein
MERRSEEFGNRVIAGTGLLGHYGRKLTGGGQEIAEIAVIAVIADIARHRKTREIAGTAEIARNSRNRKPRAKS